MGSISDYLENYFANESLKSDQATIGATYLALFESDPGDAGGGTETSYSGYSRQGGLSFTTAASRRVTVQFATTFGQNNSGAVTLTHWGIFDAISGGNLLAHGSLSSSFVVATGSIPKIPANEIYVEIQAGHVSDYWVHKLLGQAFNNVAVSRPTTYLCLVDTTLLDTNTGTFVQAHEPSGGGYGRLAIAASGWSTPSGGVVTNNNDITFGPAGVDWGTVAAIAVVDAASLGNLLFYDNDFVDADINPGDTLIFPAGQIQFVFT